MTNGSLVFVARAEAPRLRRGETAKDVTPTMTQWSRRR